MALELVGGAFLSSLFQSLFDNLASSEVLDFFRKKKLDPVLLKNLEILLISAEAVLDDAEGKQLGNPYVRKWLLQLKEVIYKAEDLMVEISDECLPTDMEGESSSRPSKVRRLDLSFLPAFSKTACEKEIEPKIQEIIDTLKLLLEQKTHLGLERSTHNGSYISPRLLATSIVEESDVYGREDDKKKIIDLLLSNDDSGNKIHVIPIIGMAGIGKTTLAGLVYHNDRVSKSFDVKEWVTVSDNFDALRITKTILHKVEKSDSQAHDNRDLNQSQEALKKALKGLKFFFVLDDVWNKNYNLWHKCMRALETGAHGSKLIVTTRDEKIASMVAPNVRPHQLGAISDEECRKLLAKHVFCNGSPSAYPNMEVISRKIVEKCKGLPLAVISLAGLLRAQPDPKEWESILHADIWEMQNNDDFEILPSLWLSYHYLPPHLKRCFAYCSLFPHDYEFDKEELILLWRAENLLAIQKGQRPEEVGEDYFNDLVARSLFRRTPNLRYVMHDLVSDLAKFVSAEFCLSWDEHNSNTSKSKARHLFLGDKIVDSEAPYWGIVSHLSQTKYLRTLLATDWGMKSSLLSVAQSLRVLSLRGYPNRNLPDSIGDFKHLRYLNLSSSGIESLPDTVCNLHNLQILLLSNCCALTQLPSKIGSLINLLHLDVTGTPLEAMPKDLYKLKSLQFLPIFVVGENNGSSINQLQELLHLHGRISISRLKNIVGVGDIAETILKDLKFVTELILDWYGWSNYRDLELERVALGRLLPHTNLRILQICGYGGTRFVDWLGDSSFSNVTSISLAGCRRCRLLPPLGQLPSLEKLKISGFDELERIGDEFFSSSTSSTIVPFRSLKELEIRDMRRWKEWSLTRAYGEAGVLPSLTRLFIWDCEQLVSLLPGEPQQQTHTPFPSLETINVSNCPMLETFLEWGSFSRLQSIDIWGCQMLFALRRRWDLQRFTSLTSLGLGNCSDSLVGSFPEEGLLPTTLTSLSIFEFGYLKSLNGRSLQQLTSLESLSIYRCKKLRCLPEERLPPSLSFLRIDDCPFLERRCQRENGEDWHKIDHISRVEITDEYARRLC